LTLSYDDIEDILAERGIDVSYQTARHWLAKSGPTVAANLRRLRSRPSDHRHLDVMVVCVSGRKHWLWPAVDYEGEELEFLVKNATQRQGRQVAYEEAAQEARLLALAGRDRRTAVPPRGVQRDRAERRTHPQSASEQ
jgi:hypothetical protein